mmetsp:Transcript_5133/g.14635  ORF Transcript_5133/g.14635 Transcript_5133/m.14635 type:complete len:283 (+) Transcript_5133:564-1412(+)
MEFPKVESTERADGENSKDDEPLLTGVLVDFKAAEPDDDDIDAVEKRQRALIRALTALELNDRPCLAVDLVPLADLDLLVEMDGDKVKLAETPYIESQKAEPGKSRPAATKIVVPARQIVDIRNLNPVAGKSVVRCNPAYPAYRWFQAMNLMLRHKGVTDGGVIPFPLFTNERDADGHPLDPLRSTVYHVLRVRKHEFEAYQKLLHDAVSEDGPDKGFFHASKYAYEVLAQRGVGKITQEVVGLVVTDVILMGQPKLRGALVFNDTKDDWGEDFHKRFAVFG